MNFCGSFCNLTVEFAVQVIDVGSQMQEIPTFVVLGSSCLTIAIVILSAYYTAVICWNWSRQYYGKRLNDLGLTLTPFTYYLDICPDKYSLTYGESEVHF